MNSVWIDFKDINGSDAPSGMVDIWNCPRCGTQVIFNGDEKVHTGTGILPTNCSILGN